jgi:hypothetical protein
VISALLFINDVDEAGVLMREAVVILSPDVRREEDGRDFDGCLEECHSVEEDCPGGCR